ncbi:hypothetical protein D3C71_1756430 [compost metagenome]
MENDKLNIGMILGSTRQQANLNGKVFEISFGNSEASIQSHYEKLMKNSSHFEIRSSSQFH